jgi:hypothetical protein
MEGGTVSNKHDYIDFALPAITEDATAVKPTNLYTIQTIKC